ncbi:hypothetical protein [Streptomyces microflavus]|uniref:hypothetical protein n=1 Tax=Streptomyces microflavus TaxID=1919 RepID=UPI0037F63991
MERDDTVTAVGRGVCGQVPTRQHIPLGLGNAPLSYVALPPARHEREAIYSASMQASTKSGSVLAGSSWRTAAR